jgi:hypothetical protein
MKNQAKSAAMRRHTAPTAIPAMAPVPICFDEDGAIVEPDAVGKGVVDDETEEAGVPVGVDEAVDDEVEEDGATYIGYRQ